MDCINSVPMPDMDLTGFFSFPVCALQRDIRDTIQRRFNYYGFYVMVAHEFNRVQVYLNGEIPMLLFFE